MWDGKVESLQGEPLLVWAEQGFRRQYSVRPLRADT